MNFGMDSNGAMVSLPSPMPQQLTLTPAQDFTGMPFADPMQTGDVLQDFDFDSFLHDGDGDPSTFDFGATSFMEGAGEIGAE